MADQRNGGISWTDETWNPIRGCRRVNDDCRECYAEQLAATRLVKTPAYAGVAMMTPDGPRWTGKVNVDDTETLLKPLRWKRPRLVFVNAMSDLFYDQVDDDTINRIIGVMALAHQHTFQVLTKRPDRMLAHFENLDFRNQLHDWLQVLMEDMTDLKMPSPLRDPAAAPYRWPLPNVWWGASMGHQAAVDELMPGLAACRKHASILWVSAEPLREALDWTEPKHRGTNVNANGWLQYLDWMVGGGESNHAHPDVARPCPLAAARRLRDDSLNRTDMGRPWGLPFQWKQWGEWSPVTFYQIDNQYLAQNNLVYTFERNSPRLRFAGGEAYGLVGKKVAGRLLDGQLWDMWPLGFDRPSVALDRERKR